MKHPVRQARLRPWLYDNAPEHRSKEDDHDSVDGTENELTKPIARTDVAAKTGQTDKPSQTRREGSKAPALERLLMRASELGVPIEDDRGGAGSVWVNLTEMQDNRACALVRKMLAMGFKHWPGRGYWR